MGLVLSGAGCKQDAYDPTFDKGVTINGVTWATRNVGEFGKFAATPEDAGMLYQWNRKTAYSATDPLTPAWNTEAISPTWNPDNDPCPVGWHVPTSTEMNTLADAANVDYAWEGSGGRFTDKAIPTNSIFLPVTHARWYTSGVLVGGTVGIYWTTWTNGSGVALGFHFNDVSPWTVNFLYLFAHPIRCVKD